MTAKRNERRRAPRVKHRMVARYKIGSRRTTGVVMDLSETGLFIQTNTWAEPGTDLHLSIGTGTVMEVDAKVVWVRSEKDSTSTEPNGMGLSIHSPPPSWAEFATKLRQSMDRRRSDERVEARHVVRFASGNEFLTEYTET